MFPSYCEICGACFQNQYFHTQQGGKYIHFADFDDSAGRCGYAPGVVGAAWICDEHAELASTCSGMPLRDAIPFLRKTLNSLPFEYRTGLEEPHLYIDDVGPNVAKVFAILRTATGMTPMQAKFAVAKVPILVAKGWPAHFNEYMKELQECGSTVRIAWD